MGEPIRKPNGKSGPKVNLRLMATTDVHMHVFPYDYVTDLPSLTVGLARTAALIRQARAEAENTLLVDNGDFLHGNPMGESIMRRVVGGQTDQRHVHPIVAAMRSLGYDAMTLGNHDFDHGVDFLGRVLENAPFPVIASNLTLRLDRPASGSGDGPSPLPFTAPFAIIEREVNDTCGAPHTLRIGLLGMLPPGSITGLREEPFRAEFRDIVETARIAVPHLRALGADLVVVLAHSGIGPVHHVPGMENAVVPLASVPGIDVIVAGHTHQVFPGPVGDWPGPVDARRGTIHGVPVVAPGFWGSHLGIVDLALCQTDDRGWQAVAKRVRTRPISVPDPATGEPMAQVKPDPRILNMLKRVHVATIDLVRKPVGQTRRRLHNFLAIAAPAPALDVVHRAMAWHAKRVLSGTELEGLPVLASTAPFKAGGLAGPGYFTDISPGPITLRGLFDLYPYPNDFAVLRLTGSELANWLERAASQFAQLLPGGDDNLLLAPGSPAYLYETVAGCDYEIDLTAPARFAPDGTLRDRQASRVRGLSRGGAPLDPGCELVLVTNTYRATGGGGYPVPQGGRVAFDAPTGMRQLIADYLAQSDPVDDAVWASWRFSPTPGRAVLFRSAPNAVEVLPDTPELDITAGDIGPEGFRCMRLAL